MIWSHFYNDCLANGSYRDRSTVSIETEAISVFSLRRGGAKGRGLHFSLASYGMATTLSTDWVKRGISGQKSFALRWIPHYWLERLLSTVHVFKICPIFDSTLAFSTFCWITAALAIFELNQRLVAVASIVSSTPRAPLVLAFSASRLNPARREAVWNKRKKIAWNW